MTPAVDGSVALARGRLLQLLGITRYRRRDSGMAARESRQPHSGSTGVLLVADASEARHPLLRPLLMALGLDATAVQIGAASSANGTPCLLALGDVGGDAVARAPAPAVLARDPKAKRALWLSIRSCLRGG